MEIIVSRRNFGELSRSDTFQSTGVLNVVTDLMLIALPIPVLVLVKRSTIE